MTLTYKTQTVSRELILSHLQACDHSFVPPLSSRVNLIDYANRLFEKSTSFEAWAGNILVGLLNAYLNDMENRIGFITNVSILEEFTRRGVASTLLKMCLEYASQYNFNRIWLEVAQANGPAIKLYSRAGFKVFAESGSNLLMEHEITDGVN